MVRQYPEVYDRIEKGEYYKARNIYMMPESTVDQVVPKVVQRTYSTVCRELNKGRFTMEQVLEYFPEVPEEDEEHGL